MDATTRAHLLKLREKWARQEADEYEAAAQANDWSHVTLSDVMNARASGFESCIEDLDELLNAVAHAPAREVEEKRANQAITWTCGWCCEETHVAGPMGAGDCWLVCACGATMNVCALPPSEAHMAEEIDAAADEIVSKAR